MSIPHLRKYYWIIIEISKHNIPKFFVKSLCKFFRSISLQAPAVKTAKTLKNRELLRSFDVLLYFQSILLFSQSLLIFADKPDKIYIVFFI